MDFLRGSRLELADKTDPQGPTHQVVLRFHSPETLRVKVAPYGEDQGRNKTVVEPAPKNVGPKPLGVEGML